MSKISKLHRYYRKDIRKQPYVWFVFGDNFERIGFGGQAKEARGESNSIGIPTKISPSRFLDDSDETYEKFSKYLEDALYVMENDVLKYGYGLVFPSDGVGTGLADLENKAPKCWKLLDEKLLEFLMKHAGVEKISELPDENELYWF